MLAEHLGLPHAEVVRKVELAGNEATIRVELEGGTDEVSKIKLPALLSIQTGINEPRYVSIMGIRKAAKKELNVAGADNARSCRGGPSAQDHGGRRFHCCRRQKGTIH